MLVSALNYACRHYNANTFRDLTVTVMIKTYAINTVLRILHSLNYYSYDGQIGHLIV